MGNEPDVSAWLFQAVRELNGLKTAMTDVRVELANNLAKTSKTEEHLALERRKLMETDDPSDLQRIRDQISQLEGKKER